MEVKTGGLVLSRTSTALARANTRKNVLHFYWTLFFHVNLVKLKTVTRICAAAQLNGANGQIGENAQQPVLVVKWFAQGTLIALANDLN